MVRALHFLSGCRETCIIVIWGAIISNIDIWNLNTFAFPVNSVWDPHCKTVIVLAHLYACMPRKVIRKTFWNTVFTKCPLTFKEYLFIYVRQFPTFTIPQGPMKYFYALIILFDILCIAYYAYNNIKYYVWYYTIGNNIDFLLVPDYGPTPLSSTSEHVLTAAYRTASIKPNVLA